MSFGIATTSIIPMRDENRHQSEMVSQVLFGELMKIIHKEDDWSKVKIDFDGTEGWIQNSMFQTIDGELYNSLFNAPKMMIENISDILIGNGSQPMKVMPGSEMHINGALSNQMLVGENCYSLKHRASIPMRGDLRQSIISKTMEYLHAPYLWGGRSMFGIDCSAFSQVVYKINGIILPREVDDQFAVGRIVKKIEDSLPGDLAFFKNEDGQICHVGILHEHNKIIHADGYVKFDRLDDNKLYNFGSNVSKYTLAYLRNVID